MLEIELQLKHRIRLVENIRIKQAGGNGKTAR